jgi:hypothetical protein
MHTNIVAKSRRKFFIWAATLIIATSIIGFVVCRRTEVPHSPASVRQPPNVSGDAIAGTLESLPSWFNSVGSGRAAAQNRKSIMEKMLWISEQDASALRRGVRSYLNHHRGDWQQLLNVVVLCHLVFQIPAVESFQDPYMAGFVINNVPNSWPVMFRGSGKVWLDGAPVAMVGGAYLPREHFDWCERSLRRRSTEGLKVTLLEQTW